jgi:hypothetical protein
VTYVIGSDEDIVRQLQDMDRAQRQREEVRKARLEKFKELFLAAGPSVTEMAQDWSAAQEALSLAGDAWHRLSELEKQIVAEKVRLAIYERGRPPEPADDMRSHDVLDKLNARHVEMTENHRKEIAGLEKLARETRSELESHIRKGK